MDRFSEKFQPGHADITLCGSMAHKEHWLKALDQLRAADLTVHAPELNETFDWSALSDDESLQKKNYFIERHLANIASADAVLVCNYEKDGEPGYVGANVLMEMMAAFVHDKPIYLLNKVDTKGKGREVLALMPVQLDGNIDELIQIMKEKK